ncbi:MAG: hydroxylamine reductase [Desulfovibrionaceae bacterium]|nr:hydroxylamine reductase [Desulfovibrionaceae bacterium]
MFCNQCEQTSKGKACTILGVCGKKDATAQMQDRLVYALRTLAQTMLKARAKNIVREDIDDFLLAGLFATLTNVNFDDAALHTFLEKAVLLRKELSRELGCTAPLDATAIAKSIEAIAALPTSPENFHASENVRSAMQTLLFGMKGVAAYAFHAAELGQRDPAMVAELCTFLVAGVLDEQERSLEDWLGLLMACGKCNIRAMELLDKGNTETYGDPVPTPVSLGHKAGKCILVSGHDLKDLYQLLVQTEGKGINIYTHGEMLPTHAYPKLHAFPHFVGHYGTAWQNQQKELPAFPGAVLFTTNCIQDPKGYADKVFTTGLVGWPGLQHCAEGDFSALIAKAQAMEGFAADEAGKEVLTGFGRKTLLGAAPALLEAVKSGAVKHIFLVGGCDGARPGRNYYTEFVEKAPKDTLILTLACGKFRFFDKSLGSIGAFPRLLDIGQCNDAYAAVLVALELAKACNCSVNELPLSLVLSWYEQKAVAILLSLLSLGVKNMLLGPSLPAFLSPDIIGVLVKEFGIAPISTPEADIAKCMSR